MTRPHPRRQPSVIDRVADFIDARGLLPARSAVLAAVSGGADSVAMLLVLAELASREERGYTLHVAHLDHGLRDESGEDAAFVARLAARLGLQTVSRRRDVGAYARDNGVSIELAARELRYAFLADAAEQAGCQFVATGHHADDNVETVLHRILRGSGLTGLRGIRPSRSIAGGHLRLIRPMLEVTRAEIQAFLVERGETWRTDPSNAETAHTRNRIRHELLPLLRRHYNPQVDHAVARLTATAEWAGQWLDDLGDSVLDALVLDKSGRRIALDLAGLADLRPIEASQAIRAALDRLGAPLRAIGMDHILALLELTAGPTGRSLDLPGELTARREYSRLIIQLGPTGAPDDDGADSYPLACPGRTELPDRRSVAIATQPGGEAELRAFLADKTANVEMIDAERLAVPLLARRWREGDRFRPLGAPGVQKLSDFFITARIPRPQRQAAWLLCDHCGPIWIAGHRIAHRVRVTAKTQRVAIIRLACPEGTPGD